MTPEDRLFEVFSPEPNTGCFIPDSKCVDPGDVGYARVKVGGELITAHRFGLTFKLGRPLRRKRIACHTCPNKWCGNPEHLYEGTYSLNTRDAARPHMIRRLRAELERLLAEERAMHARARASLNHQDSR